MNVLQTKFATFRNALNEALVERESEVDLVLTALVAREHPLLVGSPGTAKSLLLDSIAEWVDSKPFSYLLTKFTDPMELFGPIDLESLKRGENKRNVTGYLPTTQVAFLDEIFKSSSAILNTLLKMLNERTFKYGQQELKCPLILCVAASNEWPNSETMQELGALFDRFLLRKHVKQVSSQGRKKLISKSILNSRCRPEGLDKISEKELYRANSEASLLSWSNEALEAFHSILDDLNREGIFPGDRRMFKGSQVARCSAWLDGAEEVRPEHLEILAHVLWVDPEEQPRKCEEIVIRTANPLGALLRGLEQQLFDVERKAEEKLKTVGSAAERRGTIEEVIQKSKEIEQDLKTRKSSPLRDKVLGLVQDVKKGWSMKLIGVKGS